MLTNAELAKIGIKQWTDIKGRFNNANILLGNGFSINVSQKLNYKSLFQEFLSGYNSTDQAFFQSFGTTNFEFIMEALTNAAKINTHFGLSTTEIYAAIDQLKEGLIRAVEALHPRAKEIDINRIQKLSEDFDQFNNVFTLNYDALMYHVIMATNNRYVMHKAPKRFNDYYWGDSIPGYKKFMDFQTYKGYKQVYYLHGALFLFRHNAEHVKIKRTGTTELLDRIADQIKNGVFPVFISEGTPVQKEIAISRSVYLDFALRHLRMTNRPLVIYGTSLSSPDQHIIDAISPRYKSAVGRRLAISIYCAGKTELMLNAETANVKKQFPQNQIEFFDSSSLFIP